MVGRYENKFGEWVVWAATAEEVMIDARVWLFGRDGGLRTEAEVNRLDGLARQHLETVILGCLREGNSVLVPSRVRRAFRVWRDSGAMFRMGEGRGLVGGVVKSDVISFIDWKSREESLAESVRIVGERTIEDLQALLRLSRRREVGGVERVRPPLSLEDIVESSLPGQFGMGINFITYEEIPRESNLPRGDGWWGGLLALGKAGYSVEDIVKLCEVPTEWFEELPMQYSEIEALRESLKGLRVVEKRRRRENGNGM